MGRGWGGAGVGDVLGSCKQGCMAFLDIDDTLIEPKNELFQSPTLKHPIIKRYLGQLFKQHSPMFHDLLISRVLHKAEYMLTEPSVKEMITQFNSEFGTGEKRVLIWEEGNKFNFGYIKVADNITEIHYTSVQVGQ